MQKNAGDAGRAAVPITRDAAEFMLRAAASTYPSEFAGLIRKNARGEIAEVLVIPQSVYGEDYSSINLYNVPYTSGHSGSVHSHPTRSARPSKADLEFFRATGETHLILAYPFTPDSIRAYDATGKPLLIKIV
ncbi:MAG: Mov34/MPN/PAD-1 family protein [Candidatus ainarchaeum sp.]|nr:Mov34/MPN/PAD-1 family protein [Candidatus ainarchaeum sp.]